jgi:hypothetical protein
MLVCSPSNDLFDICAPHFQCLFAFCRKIVALINSCNPGNRSILVIEDLVGYVGCNAKPSHSGYAGPPQVMKPPSGDARQLVQLSLGRAKILEGSVS